MVDSALKSTIQCATCGHLCTLLIGSNQHLLSPCELFDQPPVSVKMGTVLSPGLQACSIRNSVKRGKTLKTENRGLDSDARRAEFGWKWKDIFTISRSLDATDVLIRD